MRFTRPVLVAVLSWLTVVAVGSTMVWAVISRAGEGLVTTADSTGASSQSSPAVPGATFLPSPSGRPSDQPSPSSPGSTGSSAPSSPPPSSGAPATDGPSSSSSPPSPSPPDPPQARSGVWQGLGGTVVAECTGAAISLVSASPDAGFRAQVSNPGPQELEVELEGREAEAGAHSEVRAVCVGGAPRFTSQVESERSDD